MGGFLVYWDYIGIMEKKMETTIVLGLSADLGGRVGWLPKAERVKTLLLSPLQPQNAGGGGGGGGGGGRGGIPASFPSRSPPPKQPFQPTPTPSPGSHQEVCEKIVI